MNKSIIPIAAGSVLFTAAFTVLMPTLAANKAQVPSGQPVTIKAERGTGKFLSLRQMQTTQGAGGQICDLDCNNGVNSCGFGHDPAYPNSICVSYYYHFLLCENNPNVFAETTCSVSQPRSCNDFVYFSPGLCVGKVQSAGSFYLGTVNHMVMACGGGS